MTSLELCLRRYRLEPSRGLLGICVAVLLAVVLLMVSITTPAEALTPKIKKPGAPTAVRIIAIDHGAVISWTAPTSNGGSAITGYTVKATGGKTCATKGALACSVTGLTNGHKYSVMVRASNARGLGKASSKVKVTPSSSRNCSYIGPYANLQSCDLRFAALSGINLTGANLTRANLYNQTTAQSLVGTDLTAANLSSAELEFVNLSHANLSHANLSSANIGDGDLFGADLNGANLNNANLSGVSSGHITGRPLALDGYLLAGGYLVGGGVNLSDANLSGLDLHNAYLEETNLHGANLNATNLADAYIAYASSGGITGTPSALPPNCGIADGYLVCPTNYLQGIDLSGMNMAGFDFSQTEMDGASLNGTDLSTNDLTEVHAAGVTGTPSALPPNWSLRDGFLLGPTSASLDHNEGMPLSNDDFSGVDLRGAWMRGMNIEGPVNFTNADLTGATVDFNARDSIPVLIAWSNTTCPDGTNSDNDGGSCLSHLVG